MKVKLVSDFIDYYDHWFDLEGVEFHRESRNSISRPNMLGRLANMGLQVPNSGYMPTVENWSDLDSPIIVHHDVFSHRGEDKEFILYKKAKSLYPESFAVQYIQPPLAHKGKSISYRYLRIGVYRFFLRYESKDMWRSNCGDVKIGYWHPPLCLYDFLDSEPRPMIAIDFVQSYEGLWAAIDYNTSPGLKYIPIEEDIGGKEIVAWIKEWYSLKGELEHGKN